MVGAVMRRFVFEGVELDLPLVEIVFVGQTVALDQGQIGFVACFGFVRQVIMSREGGSCVVALFLCHESVQRMQRLGFREKIVCQQWKLRKWLRAHAGSLVGAGCLQRGHGHWIVEPGAQALGARCLKQVDLAHHFLCPSALLVLRETALWRLMSCWRAEAQC